MACSTVMLSQPRRRVQARPSRDGGWRAALREAVQRVSMADVAALERFEDHVERHHLGQRRREPGLVGLVLVQHLIGARVHDDGRVAVLGRGRRRKAQSVNAAATAPSQVLIVKKPAVFIRRPVPHSHGLFQANRVPCSLQIH